jgi:hypothetical protein
VVIDGEPDAVAQWLTNGRGNPRRECLPFALRYGQPSVADARGGQLRDQLQLLSGHAEENSLAIYRDLALADVSDEYEQAMRTLPVR